MSIDIGNQQVLTEYRDEIKNSQTYLLIFLQIELDWNGCNDHDSSKPVFHMRDDVCVLKNPKVLCYKFVHIKKFLVQYWTHGIRKTYRSLVFDE